MKKLVYSGLILIIVASFTSCNKGTINSPAITDSLKMGLIAYYPLNNTGADSSKHGNDAAIFNMNTMPNRFSIPNYAYFFDGLTSYMSVNDNQALRLNNTDFTLNTWVNLSEYNASSGSFIFAKRTSGLSDGWGFSITGYQSGTPVVGGVYFGPGGGNNYAVSTKTLTTNKWYMVTVVYNLAKQQATIYINGVLDSTTGSIPTPNAAITANLYIGRDNPVNGTGYFIKGGLSDMRIYTRALSASLVQKLFLSTN